MARTAQRLNLTSSAVSHALKRLPVLLDNEFLVRDGRRMVPTARAERLAETLPAGLHSNEPTFAAPQTFDPATSTRAFRLAAPDFFSPLIPKLLNRMEREAPCTRLEMFARPVTGVGDLSEGRYDALIAPSFKQSDDLRGSVLGAWPWVVFGRRDHPGFADWSMATWARYPQLQIGSGAAPQRSPIDRTATGLGGTRHLGAVLTHFTMAPPVLAQTDMLLLVPAIALREAAQVHGLAERALPFDMPPLELTLFRSASNGDDRATGRTVGRPCPVARPSNGLRLKLRHPKQPE